MCGSDACAAPRYCVSISSLDLRAYVGDAGNGATCRPISGDLCYSISMITNDGNSYFITQLQFSVISILDFEK